METICLRHGNQQSYFLLSFPYYILLYLRFITAYYECKRYEISSAKIKGEFLARSHIISLNKGLINASSHLNQMCACLKEQLRVDHVFCASLPRYRRAVQIKQRRSNKQIKGDWFPDLESLHNWFSHQESLHPQQAVWRKNNLTARQRAAFHKIQRKYRTQNSGDKTPLFLL